MCGICGYVSFGEIVSIREKQQIQTVCDSLKHRGPDAFGIYKDDNVVLAHRRLSIIDISNQANQPMISYDGKIVVVFNGEIYNYKEIKKELSEYTFQTNHSDTEVIINAYKKWGIKCLDKFVGMFALTIYDKKNKRIFIARDRLGQKPVYYTSNNKGFYFSSEINALFNANILEKEINTEAIYHYLTFLTVNAPKTFYNNIFKLESGYYLEINSNRINKFKYWDIADYLNLQINDSFNTAVENTESLLDKSMKYRNISDVPVSLALSGGLDSSLNLHYSHNINPEIKSINISYLEKNKFNESQLAARISSSYNINFISRVISSDLLEQTIKNYLSIQQDMPMGDIVTPLMFNISKVAQDIGTKVLLVGEGGDEIGGYPIYSKLQKEYSLFSKSIFTQRMTKYMPEKYARKFDNFYDGEFISRRQIFGFTEYEKQKLWNTKTNFNSYSVFAQYQNEIDDKLPDSFLRKILNTEYKLRLPELILSRIDYPSMAASIEARSPFMDHKLIEYSAGLHFDIKMQNGAKSILYQIAKDKLPEYIINSPKIGFGKLLTSFLEETMPIWFNECFTNDAPVLQYLEKEYLNKILKQHIKNKRYGYKMWIIYALNKWLSIHKK